MSVEKSILKVVVIIFSSIFIVAGSVGDVFAYGDKIILDEKLEPVVNESVSIYRNGEKMCTGITDDDGFLKLPDEDDEIEILVENHQSSMLANNEAKEVLPEEEEIIVESAKFPEGMGQIIFRFNDNNRIFYNVESLIDIYDRNGVLSGTVSVDEKGNLEMMYENDDLWIEYNSVIIPEGKYEIVFNNESSEFFHDKKRYKENVQNGKTSIIEFKNSGDDLIFKSKTEKIEYGLKSSSPKSERTISKPVMKNNSSIKREIVSEEKKSNNSESGFIVKVVKENNSPAVGETLIIEQDDNIVFKSQIGSDGYPSPDKTETGTKLLDGKRIRLKEGKYKYYIEDKEKYKKIANIKEGQNSSKELKVYDNGKVRVSSSSSSKSPENEKINPYKESKNKTEEPDRNRTDDKENIRDTKGVSKKNMKLAKTGIENINTIPMGGLLLVLGMMIVYRINNK